MRHWNTSKSSFLRVCVCVCLRRNQDEESSLVPPCLARFSITGNKFLVPKNMMESVIRQLISEFQIRSKMNDPKPPSGCRLQPSRDETGPAELYSSVISALAGFTPLNAAGSKTTTLLMTADVFRVTVEVVGNPLFPCLFHDRPIIKALSCLPGFSPPVYTDQRTLGPSLRYRLKRSFREKVKWRNAFTSSESHDQLCLLLCEAPKRWVWSCKFYLDSSKPPPPPKKNTPIINVRV